VDGLHLRLRTSKTDQEARGTVKAVPYGRDPVTCPPCAYTRWRLLLDAADRVDPAGQRRSVMTELRRQTSDGGVDGHVCRVDLSEPAVAGRALFPLVHKTGRIGAAGMSGQAVNVVLARRRSRSWVGIRCGPGSSPKRSGKARMRTRSCGRPGTATPPSWRPTPGNMPPWSATRSPSSACRA